MSGTGGDGAEAGLILLISVIISYSSSPSVFPGQFRRLVPLVRPGGAVPVLQVFPAGQDQFQRRSGRSRGETATPQDRLQRQRDEALLRPGKVLEVHLFPPAALI